MQSGHAFDAATLARARMPLDRTEDVTMAHIGSNVGVLVGSALLAVALAACASPGAGANADPARSAENQKKQSELKGMEAVGQRNDIDKPFKK